MADETSVPGVANRLSGVDWLGDAADTLTDVSRRQRGRVAELARGKFLGHPVHPALTDLPVGLWTSAFLLDLFGGRTHAVAARRFVGLGVVSAIPTVVTGVADLPTLPEAKRRVAMIHAGANSAATLLYLMSWRLRWRRRVTGIIFGLLGAALATVGGYLGGWLAFGEPPSGESERDAEPLDGT